MTAELRSPMHGKGTEYRNTGMHESDRTIVPHGLEGEVRAPKPMISRRFGGIATREAAAPLEQTEKESTEAVYLRELFHFPTSEELRARIGDVTTDSDPSERIRVTEESERAAVGSFIGASGEVKRIIDDAARSLPLIGRDKMIPEFLRGNDAVRIELGQYFLQTIGKMSGLPDKIYKNWNKLPNAPGYARMPGRVYTAVLALAMLDGTYKHNPSMPITRRQDGTFDDGSYRTTAQRLLKHREIL